MLIWGDPPARVAVAPEPAPEPALTAPAPQSPAPTAPAPQVAAPPAPIDADAAVRRALAATEAQTPAPAPDSIVPPTIPQPDAVPATDADRRITGSRVNLRGGPSTGDAVVGQVVRDQQVRIVEDAGDWMRVQTGDGTEGYIFATFLAPI